MIMSLIFSTGTAHPNSPHSNRDGGTGKIEKRPIVFRSGTCFRTRTSTCPRGYQPPCFHVSYYFASCVDIERSLWRRYQFPFRGMFHIRGVLTSRLKHSITQLRGDALDILETSEPIRLLDSQQTKFLIVFCRIMKPVAGAVREGRGDQWGRL